MGVFVPLSISIASTFLLIYFIYSLTLIKKMKDNASSTGSCCSVTSSKINSSYVGAIAGVIISFSIMVLSIMMLYSGARKGGYIDKFRARFARVSDTD